jgi:hypothetical protein
MATQEQPSLGWLGEGERRDIDYMSVDDTKRATVQEHPSRARGSKQTATTAKLGTVIIKTGDDDAKNPSDRPMRSCATSA